MKQAYIHGTILTMEKKKKEEEKTEAILVENGRILKVGKEEEILSQIEENGEIIDLKGHTLLPAFIDSHSHITALAQTLGLVNLKEAKSIEEIKEKLEHYQKEREIPKGDWIIGFGYDHNFLKEKKHPTKWDLDFLKDHPILLAHTSGHMGVMNSLGLEKVELTEKTKDPRGGSLGRIEDGALNGYLEETAFHKYGGNVLIIGEEKMVSFLEEAQKEYLKNGITLIQDGLTKQKEWDLLKMAAESGKLIADVVSYIEVMEYSQILRENIKYSKEYQNHLRIGGYKLILDGSPQGKTAWMSESYEGEESYQGYPTYSDEKVEEVIEKTLQEKIQLLIHCNGDKASEQLITAYEKQKGKEKEIEKTRPVMIHAQTVREDQLVRMKHFEMIPSFFIAHTYYWGDIHKQNLGKRAEKISPAKTAEDLGMIYTFHQDTPVIEPNMLETIWCAVNRKTKLGETIGKEEEIDVYSALKAVTIYAAYQYFEETKRGSIKEGKIADFVVLDQNPLTIEKEKMKEIKILQTIKSGKIVYQRMEK